MAMLANLLSLMVMKLIFDILEIVKGFDSTEKHTDTKLVIMFSNHRFVLHAYNTTQNLMVQGKYSEDLAVNCLQPFFENKINDALGQITKLNDIVKDNFSQKSTKAQKGSFNCAYCDVKTSTKPDLKVHLKKCHTKPEIETPHGEK